MLGIDTSKNTLSVALRDAQTRNVVWTQTVPNTSEGVLGLLSRTSLQTPWVIEPTGRYSLLAVQMAQQAGRKVFLAPPKKARCYLQSLQSRAKTDTIDAKGLALYALCAEKLAPYPLKSEAIDTLDQLLSARKGLVLAHASLQQRQRELPCSAVQEKLDPAVKMLGAQIKALDEEIDSRTKQMEGFACQVEILKVHGIGKVTAAAVTSRLVARQFSHPDQFVAFIGLDVRVRDTGQLKGQRKLTKQGDAELRRLLYLCAQASVRTKGSPFRTQYERELAKGLARTAALCAVARKMARLCWSLHRHGTQYDPMRVGRPAHSEPAMVPKAQIDQSGDENNTNGDENNTNGDENNT